MSHREIAVSVSEIVAAPLAGTFTTAAGMDVPALIQPHAILPGVNAVEGHNAAWSAVGQRRRLTLSDKSSVHEELVAFSPEDMFAYRVSDFTGAFGGLVREARGAWHFTKTGARETQIDWTYAFAPKSPFARVFVWIIVKAFWPGYMRAALARVKAAAETSESENAAT